MQEKVHTILKPADTQEKKCKDVDKHLSFGVCRPRIYYFHVLDRN